MIQATLLFLIKRENGDISQICLAMKKRGFGVGKYNGVGGKFDSELDSNILDTVKREAKEEIGIDMDKSWQVADMDFYFPHKPKINMKVRAFLTDRWEGEPIETEEMKPEWFDIKNIPYEKMWDGDEYWISRVVKGEKVRGKFTFNDKEKVIKKLLTRVKVF